MAEWYTRLSQKYRCIHIGSVGSPRRYYPLNTHLLKELAMEEVKSQLLVNIDAIIEYLYRVPGVVAVEVEDSTGYDIWEKKVLVHFAGCAEPVLLEIS